MPSDQKEATEQQQQVFSLLKETPASAKDKKQFWKELRHFYRTGEKPNEASNGNLQSVFASLFARENTAYPYQLGGNLIEFGPDAPFEFLGYQLGQHQLKQRKRFKSKLQELIIGLSKLLSIDHEDLDNEKVYDFAAELVAFDKLSEIVPQGKAKVLSKHQGERLQKVLEDLKKGLNYFEGEVATVVVSRSDTFKVDLLSNSEMVVADDSYLFLAAEMKMKERMAFFTSFIKSFRIAALEVEGDYNEEIHEEYFNHFTWYRLTNDEKALFRPLFLVTRRQHLIDHLNEFSKFLSSNWPFRFFVLNEDPISSPNAQLSWEDASHQFRQELASLAIAHRNVFILQAALDDPDFVSHGLTDCLQANSPAVIHLLLPQERSPRDFELAAAASKGRYFPKLVYNSERKGGKMDIAGNAQAANQWPTYSISLSETGSDNVKNISFTYADYKALFPEKLAELVIVTESMADDYLVQLDEYLELEESELYGKVPYIWLCDESKSLHRAAVPNLWVVSCQERLDFWNFLKEIGGTPELSNSNEPLDETPSIKEKDTEDLEEKAISQVAERLIQGLLKD